MTRTTTAVLLLAAALGLTACGTTKPTPAPTVTVTAASSPTAPSKADLIAACVGAIAAGKDDGDGAPECVDLPTADYYEAIHQANKAAQEKFQQETDDAASATP